MEKVSSCGSPYQSDDSFGNHSTVEDRSTVTLAGHTPCHQRTLSCMKTTDSATGDTNKHNREDRQSIGIRVNILNTVPKFGQCRMIDIQHHQNTYRHEQQCDSKQRIDLTDNLIHRQQCSQNIIKEHHDNPESHIQRIRGELSQQSRRTSHKNSTDQNHQNHRETTHNLLGCQSQIASDYFRKAFSAMSQRQHTRQIVVNSTGKYTTQHNPQIRSHTEFGSHNSTKDRSQTCYVQKLNHKDFPTGKRHIVYSVGFRQSRSLTVVRTKNPFYKMTVNEIACNKSK